jgi:hypothetical protein
MDRLCRMDEYDDEQREDHYRIIQNGIAASEGKLEITEDFIQESKDLVISYYVNCIDIPVLRKTITDLNYLDLASKTETLANYLNKTFELKFFYIFCKQIMAMLNRLEEMDKETDLTNMMSNLSVKTKTRKLKK